MNIPSSFPKIFLLASSFFLSLSIHTLANAQTVEVDICRSEAPLVTLRQLPIQSAEHLQTLSQHIISLVNAKKHTATYLSEDTEIEQSSFGLNPWLTLQHAFSKKTQRDPSSIDIQFTSLTLQTAGCLHTLSPSSATLGFDLINTQSSPSFAVGAFGAYADNKVSLTRLNPEEVTADLTFEPISIENNALRYGAYAALHGDSFYLFVAYTQNDTPISLTPKENNQFIFLDESFPSLSAGFGFVADLGLLFGLHFNVQQLTTPTKAITIAYNNNFNQSYYTITPNWVTAELRSDIGFSFGGPSSLGRFSVYASALAITNTGDNTLNALIDSNNPELSQYIQDIKDFSTDTGVNANDSIFYSTFGALINYGNPYGLSGGVEGTYSQSFYDGFALTHDNTSIKLNLSYKF